MIITTTHAGESLMSHAHTRTYAPVPLSTDGGAHLQPHPPPGKRTYPATCAPPRPRTHASTGTRQLWLAGVPVRIGDVISIPAVAHRPRRAESHAEQLALSFPSPLAVTLDARPSGGRIALTVIHESTPPPTRPRTRADCANVPRPCPWVSCRHHLFLDADPETGAIKMNHPDQDPGEMTESCSLDVADRGPLGLREIGDLMGVSLERARQIEQLGTEFLRMVAPELDADR